MTLRSPAARRRYTARLAAQFVALTLAAVVPIYAAHNALSAAVAAAQPSNIEAR